MSQFTEEALDEALSRLDAAGGPAKARFMAWLLVDPEHGCIRFATDNERPAIQAVADLWTREAEGERVPVDQWDAAWDAAWAAWAAEAEAQCRYLSGLIGASGR